MAQAVFRSSRSQTESLPFFFSPFLAFRFLHLLSWFHKGGQGVFDSGQFKTSSNGHDNGSNPRRNSACSGRRRLWLFHKPHCSNGVQDGALVRHMAIWSGFCFPVEGAPRGLDRCTCLPRNGKPFTSLGPIFIYFWGNL